MTKAGGPPGRGRASPPRDAPPPPIRRRPSGPSQNRTVAPIVTQDADVLDRVERFWWRLGRGRGYERGWSDGYNAADREIQALFGVLHASLSAPARRELEQ